MFAAAKARQLIARWHLAWPLNTAASQRAILLAGGIALAGSISLASKLKGTAMSKYAFLEKSMELFDEPWKEPHYEIMAAYDKADLLDQQATMMAALFDCLTRLADAHHTPPRRLTSSDAQMLCKFSQDWYDQAKELISQVMELEDDGFTVPSAGKLREFLGRAGGWIDPVRKLAITIDEMANGTFSTLDDIRDAIRT